jgi:hypothetical protein
MLIGPVLRTISMWAAEYILLSLTLALAWISLVSLGQACRTTRQTLDLVDPAAFRPWILGHGFHRWQGENQEFASLLGRLETPDRNGSSNRGRPATRHDTLTAR